MSQTWNRPAPRPRGSGPHVEEVVAAKLGPLVFEDGGPRRPVGPCHAAALVYAAAGIPVFPLRGKVPALPRSQGGRGLYDATTDLDVVRRMWRKFPRANIGIRTGEPSGWAVVDVDAPEGLQTLAALETEHGCLPGTVTASTGGGGLHFLFRWRPGLGIGTAVWGPGLDLRGDGGYVVVAPSLHPSGRRYAWVGEDAWRHPLAPWPTKALPIPSGAPEPRRRPPPPPAGRALPAGDRRGPLAGLVAKVVGSTEGNRNACLFWAARCLSDHVAARNIRQTDGVSALLVAAAQVGLTETEALRTIDSAFRSQRSAITR